MRRERRHCSSDCEGVTCACRSENRARPALRCPSCGERDGVVDDANGGMVTCVACGVEVQPEEWLRGEFNAVDPTPRLDRDEAQCPDRNPDAPPECPKCGSPLTDEDDHYLIIRYTCGSTLYSIGLRPRTEYVTCRTIARLTEERDRLRAERDEWRAACIHAKQQRDRAILRVKAYSPGWHPDLDGPYPALNATTEETT